ncbi:MAG: STAS domain-containing protein [Anaerolineales bacterium]|nr:STAS domain-containing protein [Anaerolineales bacterium]
MEIIVTAQQSNVQVTILRVIGNVDSASSPMLLEEATKIIEAGTENMLLDLTEVDFMSSAGLRVVHQIFERLVEDKSPEGAARRREGIRTGSYTARHFKLLNPNDKLKETLELFGYDMFLEIYTDLGKALASF